jgi:hypothetical protein
VRGVETISFAVNTGGHVTEVMRQSRNHSLKISTSNLQYASSKRDFFEVTQDSYIKKLHVASGLRIDSAVLKHTLKA